MRRCRGCREGIDRSPLNGWRWAFSFWRRKRLFGKKGSRIKMGMTFAISGGQLCASHSRSFSQSEPPRGEICIANWQSTGPFHKWTGGSGHGSHTQPIRHSAPDQRPTPPRSHPTSAWPSIAAWVEGSLTLSRADSPERARTVGALFQQQGLGRVRVRGRRPTALTSWK